MNVWACLTIVFGVLAMMLFIEVLVQRDNVEGREKTIKSKEEIIKNYGERINDKDEQLWKARDRINDLLKAYKDACDEITHLKKTSINEKKVQEFKVVTACKRPVSLRYSIEIPYDISDCPNIQREVTKQAIEQLANDIIGNDLYTHRTTRNVTSGAVRHEYQVDMFKED